MRRAVPSVEGTGVGGFDALPAPAKRRSQILQGPRAPERQYLGSVTWGRLFDNILLEGLCQGCTGSSGYTGRLSMLLWLAHMKIDSGWVT